MDLCKAGHLKEIGRDVGEFFGLRLTRRHRRSYQCVLSLHTGACMLQANIGFFYILV